MPTCWFKMTHPAKTCADFLHMEPRWWCEAEAASLCLFIFGWMVGLGVEVAGVCGCVDRWGGGDNDEWNLQRCPTGIRWVSPYCPTVAKWADSSVSPCPMAGTTLMRAERGTFLPCKIPKTIIIPAREPTVLCNSLRCWEMTEPISAHTRPWELGAA